MAADKTEADPGLNTDNAIKTPQEDRLGRKQFARHLAERIASGGRSSSMVYGLAGPWGTGKTSVLNMITYFLEEAHGSKWTVVQFVPWAANDVAAITDEFFRAIAGAMPRDTEKGRKAIGHLLSMAPVAAAAVKAAAKTAIESKLGQGAVKDVAQAIAESLAERAGDVTFDLDPFQERFDKLSRAIKNAKVNVLVVVDDIDRLQPDELLTVLKAVRLLGRFDRVHYLLSYDAETVLDVLAGSELAAGKPTRATQYMEKIVQYPFVLPPLQDVYYVTEFVSALEAVAKLHGVSLETLEGAQQPPLIKLADLVTGAEADPLTLRGVYRLASQVDMLLSLVGSDLDDDDPITTEEIDFCDAVLLTHLRLRFEDVYRKLPSWSRQLTGEPSRVIDSRSRDTEMSRDDWVTRITEVVQSSENMPAGSSAQGLANLLSEMFPRVGASFLDEGADRPARIYNRDYFDRYFLFDIPVNDIRDANVRREMRQIAESGVLPSDSLIVGCLDDLLRNGVVRRKVVANISCFWVATAAHATSAAHELTRKLTAADWDLAGWGIVVYALLAHAISRAESEEAASAVVDNFVGEFGVWAGASVLLREREMAGIDRNAVSQACDHLRDQVVAVCKRDLESDVWAEGDAAGQTVLALYQSADDVVLERLRVVAQRLIADGVKPFELAARFVSVPETGGRIEWEPEFYAAWFATLVPKDEWDADNIPVFDPGEVSNTNRVFSNRIKLAANRLRQLLGAKPSAS